MIRGVSYARVCVAVYGLALLVLLLQAFDQVPSSLPWLNTMEDQLRNFHRTCAKRKTWGSIESSRWLQHSEPTQHYRDNLRPGVKYITSWIGGGFTNDVITVANMIYLGLCTSRIPILSPFYPSSRHMGQANDIVLFSDIFDLPRLRTLMRIPILEWHEVKDIRSEKDMQLDDVGCWSVSGAVRLQGSPAPWDYPEGMTPNVTGLDVSYTIGPSWLKTNKDADSSFVLLESLANPRMASNLSTLAEPQRSKNHGLQLAPDKQMFCLDLLYYVSAFEAFEIETNANAPAWTDVLRFMHWNPHLESVAERHVRNTLNVPKDASTPPYITIHARHGDFNLKCTVPEVDCFATMKDYDRRVKQIQAELLARDGITVNAVFMTSDERDKAWWAQVRAMGWHMLDFGDDGEEWKDPKDVEMWGSWYPLLMDAVLQSNAAGLVQTWQSTMSEIAGRRGTTWGKQKQITKVVMWGHPGDDVDAP